MPASGAAHLRGYADEGHDEQILKIGDKAIPIHIKEAEEVADLHTG